MPGINSGSMSRRQTKYKSTGKLRRGARGGEVDLEKEVSARRRRRIGGFAIDAFLVGPVIFLLGMLLPLPFSTFIMVFLYFSLFNNALGSGRSLGRASAGQRLMGKDGEKIGHGQVIARNAVRWLLWLAVVPFLIDLGLVLLGDGRLIADHIFGTRVYEDPKTSPEKHRRQMEQREAALEAEERLNAMKMEKEEAEKEQGDDELQRAEEALDFDNSYEYEQRELEDFEKRLTGSYEPVQTGASPSSGSPGQEFSFSEGAFTLPDDAEKKQKKAQQVEEQQEVHSSSHSEW